MTCDNGLSEEERNIFHPPSKWMLPKGRDAVLETFIKGITACLHYRTVLEWFPRNHSGTIQNGSDARLHCPKQIGSFRSISHE